LRHIVLVVAFRDHCGVLRARLIRNMTHGEAVPARQINRRARWCSWHAAPRVAEALLQA
jgi:hypothetical protein